MKSLSAGYPWRSWLSVGLVVGCLFTLLLVPGCGGKRSTPEKAAKAYFNATKKKDMDAMMECFAPDVRKTLRDMIKISGKDEALKNVSKAGAGKLEKFKVLGTKTRDDWADVEMSLTVDGKETKETLSLHKVEGEWLIDMPDEAKDAMKVGLEMMKDPEKTKKIMDLMQRKMPRRME